MTNDDDDDNNKRNSPLAAAADKQGNKVFSLSPFLLQKWKRFFTTSYFMSVCEWVSESCEKMDKNKEIEHDQQLKNKLKQHKKKERWERRRIETKDPITVNRLDALCTHMCICYYEFPLILSFLVLCVPCYQSLLPTLMLMSGARGMGWMHFAARLSHHWSMIHSVV